MNVSIGNKAPLIHAAKNFLHACRKDTEYPTPVNMHFPGRLPWPGVLAGDEVLAGAILDRLLHSATVMNIQGRSYRLKDLEAQLSEQARNGGNQPA